MSDTKSESAKPARSATRSRAKAKSDTVPVEEPRAPADDDGFSAGIVDEPAPVAVETPEPAPVAPPEPEAKAPPRAEPHREPAEPPRAPRHDGPRVDPNEHGFDAETNSRYEEIKKGNTYITELQHMTLVQLQKAAKEEYIPREEYVGLKKQDLIFR